MSTGAVTPRSGWVTFAGITALVAGAYNALSGLSTIAGDYPRIEDVGEVLFGISVSGWAWFWLIVGIVQLATGVLILMRNLWGYLAGIMAAGVSAVTAVFGIFDWPLWAFAVLMLDMLVLHALLTHEDEFD